MTIEQNQTIQKIADRLRAINPHRVILFGSYAWGEPHVDSDIDLVVILDREKPFESFRERIDNVVNIRRLLYDINREVSLDLLVYSRDEWRTILEAGSSFLADVEKRGVVLQ
jgi:predicted nucleotidyltransferase